ncbi:MAG TPA: aspartate 1-decarboxylase [Firmicutes bacterium]|nr:aspartate 1-decarboxylase [Bacillota bacterium]
MRNVLKSKLHRARVTDANVDYEGSITIDEELMELADLVPWEKVQVVDVTNGARLETYVIPGSRGSGCIQLNGAAARLIFPNDLVIIMSYTWIDEAMVADHKPKIILLDEQNRPKEVS